MTFLRKIMTATTFLGMAGGVSAGTIDLDGAGYDLGSTYFAISSLEFDLSDPFGFGPELTVGGISAPIVSSLDPTDAQSYALNFTVGISSAIDGSVGASDIAAMDGSIQLLFEGIALTGGLVGTGSGAVLVTISDTEIDVDETAGTLMFFEGASADGATVRVQTLNDLTPVPLPAGLPLVLAGVGAFAWVKRQRKATA